MRVGRTYRVPRYGRSDSSTCAAVFTTIVIGIIILGLGSAWIASEVEQVRFQTAHAEAVDKVYMLHGEHDTSSYYEGRLVYVNSTSPVVPTTPPVDVDFNLRVSALYNFKKIVTRLTYTWHMSGS
jgi:hypothetical protein